MNNIDIMRLKDNTGETYAACKRALAICNGYASAYEYLRIRHIAVASYKIINGKKVSWEEQDYINYANKKGTSCKENINIQ